MKMKLAALCASTFCLAGCVSGRSQLYASTRQPKGGIVRYAGAGGGAARQSSREGAQKLMDSYCSGPHHVVTEGPYRVLEAGADVVPAGEYGFSVQNSEENYWLIVFDCGPGAAAAQPAPAAAPVVLDFAALRAMPTPELYRQLVSADAAQAARCLEEALPAKKTSLTSYIFKNKGSASGYSWQFQLAPGLERDEKRFVIWYLQNYTDYKPVY
ncbi:MAG: hypothetical protein A2X36_14395 [Elusimicrobia bacterium GWA2_69_24]|nr:MAG: hypothetical protein A2X36_14395 [Elusimicrobia bacterium GWA2_69_24]HBL18417.1 hypothetical protein [Elusimicrobiota bacterium]